MPQYLSPGVYVEESPGSPPIVGVGTSTAGFVGKVDDKVTMPVKPGCTGKKEDGTPNPDDFYKVADVGKAEMVTNWEQFKNKFGDFQSGNQILAHAVYGFFNNGGTRCWVVRVDISDATKVEGAMKTFEAVDEIAIVAVPGAQKEVQEKVIDHCEKMKDRFAILDGKQTNTIDVENIGGKVKNSNYAALYFPCLKVKDPASGKEISTPPSGHIAGIYARVDQERGVHKAPANEVVRGTIGVEYPVSKNEQEGLNPAGINVIRAFNGNIKVWGARTLGGQANGEYMYINVRRLMNFIKESIEEGTQFAVFEPNNTALWQKIVRSVRAFLTNVWRDGALFGNTAEEAFYVKCDETTNPPEVRELGQVITEIGVAIVKPAEFVIFRISQITLPSA